MTTLLLLFSREFKYVVAVQETHGINLILGLGPQPIGGLEFHIWLGWTISRCDSNADRLTDCLNEMSYGPTFYVTLHLAKKALESGQKSYIF